MTKFAQAFFMFSICSWIMTLAITPVGGWTESNPWREYYMNAFSIAGVLTLVSIGLLLYVNRPTKVKR